jgi:hypothetical protein
MPIFLVSIFNARSRNHQQIPEEELAWGGEISLANNY